MSKAQRATTHNDHPIPKSPRTAQTEQMSQKRSRTTAFSSSNNNASPPPHAPYALYGTPLTSTSAYVPEWKQEVLDDRGRKRLHGAFTGGFSAGYYNTVGSKEGWTPGTFVSSRDKQKGKDGGKDGGQAVGGGQRVEDFMDAEDLAERESTQTLEVEGGFAGLGGGPGGKDAAGGMFGDLFRPSGEERMGVKLLQRMGWRAGQGIGPKIRRKAQGDDGKGEEHLFAPENVEIVILDRKTDRKGLGFAGEGALGEQGGEEEDDERDARILSQGSRSRGLVNKPGKVAKKSSLGVGVLNDTGSDDEDPYAIGPTIKYNRIIGGDKKNKKVGLTNTTNASSTVTRPSKKLSHAIRPTPTTTIRKCHDLHPPLAGFILSLAPLTISDSNPYPPPVVPEHWISTKLPPSTTSTSSPPTSNLPSTADAARASTLNPASRAALLGEETLKGKSVFDFLSPAARSKLSTASGIPNLPTAKGEGAPAGFVSNPSDQNRTLWDFVPMLDKETAIAALHRGNTGWMPYSEDEGKRGRYRYFLELRAGEASGLPERPAGMGVEAWRGEMREFAQAAEVFRPVSGLLGGRFMSSGSGPRVASDAPEGKGTGREREGVKEVDPAEQAAKLGLFGAMTRARLGWALTRLLCKRFNVRPPAGVDPGEGAGGEGTAGGASTDPRLELVGKASLDRMMREASWGGKAKGEGGGFVGGGVEGGFVGGGVQGGFVAGVLDGGSEEAGEVKAAEAETGREQAAVVNAEANEALEGRKAGEAVFRAIFGESDGEEE
ncbi:hypothetical protein LTR56_020240 [Elasticomyces elasticus]|nr:hypothetical protein LTR56_020240 [Elasticomyces elasticus]KAK3633451.1 hypothetical protein LTR22_020127 [Elasticomyces elasticus]KAK4907433.1 hypothetical protein LTR49_023536 [Elasticomyces elasticus]KAK5747841.1 hypothetical protein LTS12_022098 [Elasticomyces elasticus]